MQVNIDRMKKWDWGVVIAFVVSIISVSIPWWNAFGVNGLGWDFDAGVAAFIFSLFAVIWVGVKMLLPADAPLPKWYMEAWPVLVFGAIIALCGLVGAADKPGTGVAQVNALLGGVISWRPGGLITMLVGFCVVGLGVLMLKDKSGDYGQSPMPDLAALKQAVQPQDGSQAQQGAQAPPAAAPKFCADCGSPTQPGDTACKNCGKAL